MRTRGYATNKILDVAEIIIAYMTFFNLRVIKSHNTCIWVLPRLKNKRITSVNEPIAVIIILFFFFFLFGSVFSLLYFPARNFFFLQLIIYRFPGTFFFSFVEEITRHTCDHKDFLTSDREKSRAQTNDC